MNRTAHILDIEVFWHRAKVSTQSTAIDITRRTRHTRCDAPEETVSTQRCSIPGIPTGSQWKNRKDAAAAHGGCRHKAMYWSIEKQAPPYIAMNYKTPADYIARHRHIKPGTLIPTEHNRSEMGLTIGCLEKCTDHTAFVSHIRKTTNGLIPTQRTT
jgi:hypothetical protein